MITPGEGVVNHQVELDIINNVKWRATCNVQPYLTVQNRPEWVTIPESLEQLTQDLPLCHGHCCEVGQVKEQNVAYTRYN